MVAVSTVFGRNGLVEGFHVIVVAYWPPFTELNVELTGVPPVTGAVMPEMEVEVITALAVVIEVEGDEAFPVPTPFVACTVNVYGLFGLRPVIEIGEVVPVAVIEFGEEVTV